MGTHGQEEYKDQIDGVEPPILARTSPLVDKYALSPAWSKTNDFRKPFDYTLQETGQTVLLRRLDMGDLLKLGIAEELDFMSKELMGTESTENGKPTEALTAAITKAENFERMDVMINKVVATGVVKPPLHLPPRDEAARQLGLIYVDSVPFTDRIELFSVIFETEGLSTFRQKQENGVGNLADVPSVQLPADGPVGVRPDDSEGVLLQ